MFSRLKVSSRNVLNLPTDTGRTLPNYSTISKLTLNNNYKLSGCEYGLMKLLGNEVLSTIRKLCGINDVLPLTSDYGNLMKQQKQTAVLNM